MIIWHIAFADQWEAASRDGQYRWSTRDRTLEDEGFVHFSDSCEQCGRVASYFYGDVDGPMVLVSVDTARLRDAGLEIRHEPGSPHDVTSERFPHVYGGPLPTGLVDSVQTFDGIGDLIAYCESR